MDRTEARKAGYKPLTHAYNEKEGWMMANVFSDMARGGVDAVGVLARDGIEVWRRGMHEVGKLRDYSRDWEF